MEGHLAVLQVGPTVFGIDLDDGRVLWQQVLFGPSLSGGNPVNISYTADEQGVWVMQIANGLSVKTRLGQIGAVHANYVALVTQKGLTALDPVTGETLWIKTNLAMNVEVFGDDQFIYYIETANGAAVGAGRCLRASDALRWMLPTSASFIGIGNASWTVTGF